MKARQVESSVGTCAEATALGCAASDHCCHNKLMHGRAARSDQASARPSAAHLRVCGGLDDNCGQLRLAVHHLGVVAAQGVAEM